MRGTIACQNLISYKKLLSTCMNCSVNIYIYSKTTRDTLFCADISNFLVPPAGHPGRASPTGIYCVSQMYIHTTIGRSK